MLRSIKITLTISFLLASLSLFTQNLSVRYFGEGQSVFVSYYDGNQMQRYVIPDPEENPDFQIKGQNAIYNIDLSFVRDKGELPADDGRHDIIEWIEPGIQVEGDLPCDMEYSKDGSMFAVIYEHSDNVIFYNATSKEILAAVQVPRQPMDLKMGENHAYVCCHAGQGLVEISLEDFSVTNYFPFDGTPCQVEVSPGDDTAFVSCNSWLDGWITAVDLNTGQYIYESWDPWIHLYGHEMEMGRTRYLYTKFNLSPKGDQFIAGDTTTRPTIFDARTGLPEKTFNIGGYRSAGYSPTGDTLFIYSNREDTIKMFRINTADNSVIDSIQTIADIFLITDYSDLAISHDGSRVVVGDAWNSRLCRFDFNLHACQVIDQGLLYPDTPIFSSAEGDYAVVGMISEVGLIDFANGQTYNTWSTGITCEWPLCVSPKSNNLLVGNLPFYIIYKSYNENLYSVNFKFIDNITLDTTIVCGYPPEADVPVSAYLTHDGEKILVANFLTHNISVIDFESHQVDTIIFIPHISAIKIVPGSDAALVYGEDCGKTSVLSLSDYSILKELNTGSVDEALITNDGQTGYLLVYQGSNTLSLKKIHIDAASTEILSTTNISGVHCKSSATYLAYFNSTFALSPDGTLLLVGSDDPVYGSQIDILDAETIDLLTSVNVPECCIFSYAFTPDSKRVVATGEDASQVPIIYLDREYSHLENLVPVEFGSYSADYNRIDGYFYLLEQTGYIHKVDPMTGDILESFPTYMDENWRIKIDQRGVPMVLTSTTMIYDRESYAMPGVSTFLNYDFENDLFLSAVPGPDMVCVFDPKMVGIQQFKTGKDNNISIFPNPANDQVVMQAQEEILHITVSNPAGKEIFSKDFNDRNVKLSIANLKSGIYMIRITTRNGIHTGKLVVNVMNP
jgi:DNA-binding beta-propeller fold protein YncE